MSRRRILVIYNTGQYLLRMRRELLEAMIEGGDEVTALVPFDEAVPQLEAMGVRCVSLPMTGHSVNPITELKTLIHLVRAVRKIAPDIIFSFTIKPIIYSAIASRFTPVRGRFAMITGLGLLFSGESTGGRLIRGLARFAYRQSLKGCDAVFFQNLEHRSWFLSNGIVTEDNAVHINGSGVDLEQFAADDTQGIPGSFLMACRLLRYKGVGEYVEAATRLGERFPGAKFVLAGPLVEGPGAIGPAELAALLKGSGVDYRGELDDVRPAVREAEVVVLPSFYPEGVPRILIEALALGRAIITTDTPGCRTTVVDRVTGLLVVPKDADSLENAMATVLEANSEDTNPIIMGRAGRRLAEERFDVRQVNARILERIARVIQPSREPATEPVQPKQDQIDRAVPTDLSSRANELPRDPVTPRETR